MYDETKSAKNERGKAITLFFEAMREQSLPWRTEGEVWFGSFYQGKWYKELLSL